MTAEATSGVPPEGVDSATLYLANGEVLPNCDRGVDGRWYDAGTPVEERIGAISAWAPVAQESVADLLAQAFDPTATPYGSSRYGTYLACPRAHHLRYNLRVWPTERAKYFQAGNLMHGVLGYVSLASTAADDAEVDWLPALEYAENERLFDADVLDEGERVLSAYFEHYGTAFGSWPGFETVGVEQFAQVAEEFAKPYTTRLDLVLRGAGGRLVLVDHKSRSQTTKAYEAESGERNSNAFARSCRANPQFVGSLACAIEHYQLDYIPLTIINCLIKTKQPKFERVVVEVTERDLAWWRRQHAEIAAENFQSTRCNYRACAPTFGPKCDYFRLCHDQDGLLYHNGTEALKELAT